MTADEASVHEAHRRLTDGGVALIDVREPWEWEQVHIAGATLIPLGDLPEHLAEIPGDRDVFVHCKSGGRSTRAVRWLHQAGRDRAINVAGGIEAWQEAGLPVE
jgi:rhodanese-related sulfurtransferase